MNQQPKRRNQPARVEELPSALAGDRDMFPSAGLATLSRDNDGADEDELFFEAKYEGRTRRYTDVVEGEEDGVTGRIAGLPAGTVTGVHPDRIPMWKPTPNGFSMRVVAVTSIKQNLQNGWRSRCPDCGRNDHAGGPNDCPGREPVMYTICPVCPDNHRVYDNYQLNPVSDFTEREKDPAFVQFDAFKNSTPQARVEMALTAHMWLRHPQETRAMGIAPLPEPSLTVLESMLQGNPTAGSTTGGNG